MKKSHSIVAALAGVFLAGSAFAYTPVEAKPKSSTPILNVVPTKVVNPTGLPWAFADSTVNVEFSLDQSGKPREIRVHSISDPIVTRQVTQAFSQWEFKGDVTEANTSGKRFVLPLKIRS